MLDKPKSRPVLTKVQEEAIQLMINKTVSLALKTKDAEAPQPTPPTVAKPSYWGEVGKSFNGFFSVPTRVWDVITEMEHRSVYHNGTLKEPSPVVAFLLVSAGVGLMFMIETHKFLHQLVNNWILMGILVPLGICIPIVSTLLFHSYFVYCIKSSDTYKEYAASQEKESK